jgi:hypothetical protein
VGTDLSQAWSLYYTAKRMQMLRRRATATGVPVDSLIEMLVNFATTAPTRKRAPAPACHIPAQAFSDCYLGCRASTRLTGVARLV